VVSPYLDREVSGAQDVVDCCRVRRVWVEQAAKILQESITNHVMALILLDNPEELGLSVSIQRPWVVIQSEEAVSVELSLMSSSLQPFLVED
jgi:hypothetical protein